MFCLFARGRTSEVALSKPPAFPGVTEEEFCVLGGLLSFPCSEPEGGGGGTLGGGGARDSPLAHLAEASGEEPHAATSVTLVMRP